MIFRIFILGVLIYWAIRLASRLFSSGENNVEVGGKSKKTPLDLTDKDVQDVDYKEIKD